MIWPGPSPERFHRTIPIKLGATWTPPRPFSLLAPSTFFLTLFPLLQFVSWFPSPSPIGTTSDARLLTASSPVYNPMAGCNPSPTLTLFRTVISTTIITTSTLAPQTQPDGERSSNSVSALGLLFPILCPCIPVLLFQGLVVLIHLQVVSQP